MADSGTSILNKLKSLIGQLIYNSGNVIDGYKVSDANIENKSGQVTANYTYTPEIEGNEVPLYVTISATNVGQVFNDVIKGIDNLSAQSLNAKAGQDLMIFLAGEIYYDSDISLKTIEARGEGLLGVDLEKCSPDDSGDWYSIAFQDLKYSLICETDQDDTGSANNQKLVDCIDLIHRYIGMLQNKYMKNPDAQLSHKDKLAREDAKNAQINKLDTTDAFNLIRGILITIQGELKKRYQDRLNEELSLDRYIKQPPKDVDNESTTEEGEVSEESTDTENTNTSEGEPTMESKHITVKLQKIEGSEDISLLGLQSNYSPSETLSDIDEIVNQPEFIAILETEPEMFGINVDDDGFDIEKCEECEIDPQQSLNKVLNTGVIMYRNLYILHWMAKGNDMMKLHELSQELYEELIEEIDTLGELLVEKFGTVENLNFEWTPIEVKNYEFQESLNILKTLIQEYIDAIDYAYPNQTSDVQSTLDEWLRYWNKQSNYFIERQEV